MKKKYEQTRFDKQAQERMRYVIDTYFGGSQQTLSEKCGIHKASVSQYVNGKNVPSNLTAKKICDPLGLNPAWLMGFDVPMHTPQDLGPDSGDLSDGRNLYYQEIIPIIQKLSDDNLHRLIRYAEKLHDIQTAEEELK